jgi:hypothetical protein
MSFGFNIMQAIPVRSHGNSNATRHSMVAWLIHIVDQASLPSIRNLFDIS